jgi:hypothetical protein
MKCTLCNYTNSPENLNQLVAHLEHCENPSKLEAQVLWRDGELVATLDKPAKDEHVFDITIPTYDPAPEPPVAEPIPAIETTVQEINLKEKKISKSDD